MKMDQVARMGGNWYSRANQGLFEVPKPVAQTGIGIDQIPDAIKLSSVLTGNDLGMLGNVEQLPSKSEVQDFVNENIAIRSLLSTADTLQIHKKAQEFLGTKNVDNAWKVLLAQQE
jgi:hypothetical protein